MDQYKSEAIKRCLLFQQSQYRIIANDSATAAEWWRAFGFPEKLNDKEEFERIPGFISCLKCKNTQIYNKSSGTKRYKEHADKCFPIFNKTTAVSSSTQISLSPTSPSSSPTSSSSSSSISFTSSTQVTLNQLGFKRSIKLNENDRKRNKDLSVEWICGSIRPFCI